MKILKLMYLIIVFSAFPMAAIQFLYPVAVKDEHVYCIYQSGPEIMRMLIWDYGAKEIMPGLLPRFMPAGFELLPNNSGYSFIDGGILHVQKFIKRSPKSLEFYAPIYQINVPVWIDENMGLFSAKIRNYYGIFQFDINAQLAGLLIDPKKDFLYPQKIGSRLFYIERTNKALGSQFRIMSIEYPQTVDMTNDDEQISFTSQLGDKNATELIDFHNEPIAFLKMITATTGFVFAYPTQIEDTAESVSCSYYQIFSKNGIWKEQRLFDFNVPASLLLNNSSDRLYESILPLLPRHIANNIYFVDCRNSENHNLNVYEYNGTNQHITQLTYANQPDQHYMAPILMYSSLYCGGTGFDDRLHFLKFLNN